MGICKCYTLEEQKFAILLQRAAVRRDTMSKEICSMV